eukprot:5330814-Amphidinium_carterae.3
MRNRGTFLSGVERVSDNVIRTQMYTTSVNSRKTGQLANGVASANCGFASSVSFVGQVWKPQSADGSET